MIENIKNKEILIAGFGVEGKSTAKFLLKNFPGIQFTIADEDASIQFKNPKIAKNPLIRIISGDNYLQNASMYDFIIRSPGIDLSQFPGNVNRNLITSQTEIFIRHFSDQIIGVTGTKGKSTTTSLLFHILHDYNPNTILVGNIGTPPLDLYTQINPETKIIYELSSFQLEDIHQSPHIAILLNLYQEHLDRYGSFSRYQQVKFNIARYQKGNDILIYNDDDRWVKQLVGQHNILHELFTFSIDHPVLKGCYMNEVGKAVFVGDESDKEYSLENIKLLGNHNRMNILCAILTCNILNIPDKNILSGIESYKGLEHRLEYVGKFKDIHFYNDSIATIPEATIHAIETLKTVNTLILGGHDRGIDYSGLMQFLAGSGIKNIIFMGEAGERMFEIAKRIKRNFDQNLFFTDNMKAVFEICLENTEKHTICLLSPAAASYGLYKNFSERGDIYKRMAENL